MPGNSQMSKYEKPKVMSQTGRYISTAALIAISPFLSTKSIAADLKCTQTPTCTLWATVKVLMPVHPAIGFIARLTHLIKNACVSAG